MSKARIDPAGKSAAIFPSSLQSFRSHHFPSHNLANRRGPFRIFLYATERGTEKYSMHAVSDKQNAQDRRIGLRITSRSLAPRVLDALCGLGYTLEEFEQLDRATLEDHRVWLVDADRVADFPAAGEKSDTRILLIASPRQACDLDPRVFAHTQRPGRLATVYGMLQFALEANPRLCPRIRTQLSARLIRSDRRAIGAVLSLSESGCLLRTSEALRKGSKVNLQFALPHYGLISTRAECRYTRRGDAGFAFAAPAPDIRNSIAQYVTHQLAAAEGLSNVDPLRDARSA
jgi:hypothetical protein